MLTTEKANIIGQGTKCETERYLETVDQNI